jgi:hypothetical protein
MPGKQGSRGRAETPTEIILRNSEPLKVSDTVGANAPALLDPKETDVPMADDIAHLCDPAVEAPPERPAASGMSARMLHLLRTGPDRPLTPRDPWWGFAARATTACVALALAIWLSAYVDAAPALHNVALFVHLASLVLGFGAVLIADYFLLLWMLGRTAFIETMNTAMRLHLPVWTGLTGLVVSGMLLHPNLSSGLTQLKLAFVFALTLNGMHLPILGRRMADSAGTPSPLLLAWGASATTISQVCWWSAVLIGFWNTTNRM